MFWRASVPMCPTWSPSQASRLWRSLSQSYGLGEGAVRSRHNQASIAPAGGGLPVILDCDTGADDAIAILMAAASSRCHLLGVTTCHGNTSVANVTENSLRTLEAAGFANIPVVQGAAIAVHNTCYDRVPEGADTLKDLADLKSSSSEQSKLLELPATTGKRTGGPCSAVRWLVEHIHANPGVALVLTGPMTNIALALRQDPSIVNDVSEVVFMGGTFSDHLQKGIEFNISVDPQAAKEVLNANWRKIVMVGLDVTAQALFSADDLSQLKDLATPAALTAYSILAQLDGNSWSSASKGVGGLEIYDACALASWLRPELLVFEGSEVLKSTIDTILCRVDVDDIGRTICDLEHTRCSAHGLARNVYVGTSIDRDGLVATIESTLVGSY